MSTPLAQLVEYLDAQIAEAERSAMAYRAQAAQCRELCAGLDAALGTLRAAGGDAELEEFAVTRIARALDAEESNAQAALPYDAEAARLAAARERLAAMLAHRREVAP